VRPLARGAERLEGDVEEDGVKLEGAGGERAQPGEEGERLAPRRVEVVEEEERVGGGRRSPCPCPCCRKKASRVPARSASSGRARRARSSGCSGAEEAFAEGERRRWRLSESTLGLGLVGFTQVGSGVGRSAIGVGLSWRSVRESSGSSCSEREGDAEPVAVAAEEQRMVAVGFSLVLGYW
jgi:hypothetical protein